MAKLKRNFYNEKLTKDQLLQQAYNLAVQTDKTQYAYFASYGFSHIVDSPKKVIANGYFSVTPDGKASGCKFTSWPHSLNSECAKVDIKLHKHKRIIETTEPEQLKFFGDCPCQKRRRK